MKIRLAGFLFLLSFILFTAIPAVHASSYEAVTKPGIITGVIHDSTTNGAIEYATVGLYRVNDAALVSGVVTDNAGRFTFRDIPAGEYHMDASFLGYVKKRVHIVLNAQFSGADLGTILLHPDIQQIGEVQVVAQSQRVEYKIDKKVVNVAQDITSAGGTLANVLENTPSVEVDVEGNVSLRGSSNFQLLIDGKPSVIQGSEGLQQIPASAVQSLEIITSPSAKYDPDGNAGIINVIMKKQKNSGVGGVINASVGTGNKYTGDFLLNIKKNKINYFIGGELADQQFLNNGESERRTYHFNPLTDEADTTTYTISDNQGVFSRKSIQLKSGLDFSLTDQSNLSLSGAIGNRGFSRDFKSRNQWYTQPVSRDSFYLENSDGDEDDVFYNLNLDFQRKYDEDDHNLMVSLYYAASEETESEEDLIRKANQDFIPLTNESSRTRSRTETPEKELRFELDYTKPVGKGKIETGFQSRWDADKASYIYEDYYPGTDWTVNDSISNRLTYLDALQSVYFIYSGRLGKFEYQGGLRSEYDNRNLTQKTSNESFIYEKLHFFPSVFITRKLSDAHQVQFTYSRRIQRPDERDLNPFREFRGSNNVFYGNPSLRPEFTNAFELNYQYTFEKGFVSLETYYRGTYDKITRINGVDTISGRPVYTSTSINANKDHSLGIELMTNMELTKWWQVNLTGNFFRYQLDGELEGRSVSSVSTSWRTNFTSSFKLKWDTRIQLSGFYNGPSNTLQGKREGFFVTNLAIRKDMLNKKMSVSLNARDLFATGVFSYTSEGSAFYNYNKGRREAPVIMLNLTYRINNFRQSVNRRGESEGGQEMNMDEVM